MLAAKKGGGGKSVVLVIGVSVKFLIYVSKDSFNYIIFVQNNPTRCLLYENNLVLILNLY